VVLVFMRRHVLVGVTDPRYVERQMSVPVFGEILFSQQQLLLDRLSAGGGRKLLAGLGGKSSLPFHKAASEMEFRRASGVGAATTSAGAGNTRILAARFPHDTSVEAL